MFGALIVQGLVRLGLKFDHRVLVAGNERRRLSQSRAVEKPAQFPGAIAYQAGARLGRNLTATSQSGQFPVTVEPNTTYK
jgi:hypothetical protein